MASDNSKKDQLKTSEKIPGEINYVKTIDVNKIRLRLLIICSDSVVLEPAVTYLNRRGWSAQLTNSVSEGFKRLITFEPNFVILSVRAKSAKIEKIPAVIYQSFKVPVLLFGEDTDALTIKLMQEINSNFKLPGPATGPSIHRHIRNILTELSKSHDPIIKELYSRATRESSKADKNQSSPNWKKNKKGYTFSTEEDSVEKTPKVYAFEEEVPQSDEYNLDQEVKIEADTEDNESSVQPEEKADNDDQALRDEILANTTELLNKSIENELVADLTQINDDTNVVTGRVRLEKNLGVDEAQIRVENQKEVVGSSIEVKNKLDKFDQQIEGSSLIDLSEKLGPSNAQIIEDEKKRVHHYIVQIAEAAAHKTILDKNADDLDTTLALWTTHTKNKSNAILLQVYSNSASTRYFFNEFAENLNKYLNENEKETILSQRIDIKRDADLNIKLDDELFTTQIGSEELSIVIKYVALKERTPNILKANYPDRYKVDGNDLVVGLPSGSDVFIYLPNNNRFIRYVDENVPIADKQKKIISKSEAYILSNAENTYKTNYVRNKAIEKIFTDKKKNKKSA